MSRAIYPGSFDPVTLGHLDIIKRSAEMFDELIVGVLNNTAKSPLFSLEERVNMLKDVLFKTPTITWSNIAADLRMISRCPSVTGSKLPG